MAPKSRIDDASEELRGPEMAPPNTAKTRAPNALANASWLSRLFFTWPYDLLKIGLSRPLEDTDLFDTMEVDSSSYQKEYLLRLWKEEQTKHPESPSLHRAIVKDFFGSLWYIQPLMLTAYVARVAQAVVLANLIEYFEGNNDDGYMWASILIFCGVLILFEHHHVFFITWRKGMQLRVASVAAIYDKSLRLSSTHQDTTNSYGRIMNLASNDVERFLMAALFVNHLFWAPVQSIAILIIGCTLLGPAFAAGFALLISVFVPLQFYLSGRFAFYRSKIAAITDKRVSFVAQAVRGARVMKMSGYEHRFLERIQEFRREETEQITNASNLKACNEALFFVTNVVIVVAIFMVHVGLGGVLAAGDVFMVFTLINVLQLEMAKHVSLGVMGSSECAVSISRIQHFLEFPELPSAAARGQVLTASDSTPDEHDTDHEEKDGKTVAIAMSNVKCYWNEVAPIVKTDRGDDASTDGSCSTLCCAVDNVTVDFRRGQLTAVLGTVGSGKSALLQALAQELPVSSGTLSRRYKTLSYAAQDAWIMDGTVRENIIMGEDYDVNWYNTVVKACCLVLDFQQLRNGDQTIVGDRGVQCSGGQRARIGLARALYRDADVLIADDPLSAVDAKVGRQLFQDALMGLAVNRGKCVVLATHQHQHIHDCRCILVCEGHIECIGTYDEIVAASGGNLTAHAADSSVAGASKDKVGRSQRKSEEEKVVDEIELEREEEIKETSVQGIVRGDTYINYIKAMGGYWVAIFLFCLFSATQGSVLFTIAVVGRWAQRPADEQNDWDILGLVMGMSGVVCILALFRAWISFRITINASRRLHDRMAAAVLRAKIEFFDTNPLGRILNRFSADVGSNDDALSHTLFDFFMIAFIVVGAIVTTIITMPFTLVAVPPLTYYFWTVRRTFVTSTRELKRLEGMARSPIFAMLGESLGGIATIRANGCVDYFRGKFEQAHDTHTRAFFCFIGASRWVGFRMDSILFWFLVTASFSSVLFHQQGWFDVDPSILGLSLSFLLQLAGIFQWCIRQSAEVVNQMVSVERVLQFGKVPPEAPLEREADKQLDKAWPDSGALSVENLSVRYRSNLPLALKDVSFSIPAGSRCGVVGRTGSGKSTLVQSLFRLLEADSGRIVLDGVDLADLGLHTVRPCISVIPQSPTLFSGCTVRENLDLFGLHSDERVRAVLAACHLEKAIQDLPLGWSSVVAEGGSNFSVGQRQLLCLARALLNDKSKLLILDEATASVDRRTDQLLQEALQKTWQSGTILAVAHRLDTVIDFDNILVLGPGGRVLEFGPPAELLQKEGSAFSSMVQDTGHAMSSELRQRALKDL